MRAIHPGEHLREDYLKEMGISGEELAISTGVEESEIIGILTERRGIDQEIALRLGKYLGTSQEYWMNWQNEYDKKTKIE